MLTDFNSDLGLTGSGSTDIIVEGQEALGNMLKNLFRSQTMTDRFEYIDTGLDLDKLLQEPASLAGANAVFMMVNNCLMYNMPQIRLDTTLSRVIPNYDTGEYDVQLVLNDEAISFSL